MKNLEKKNLEKKNLEKRISRSGYRIETPVRFGFLECLLCAWYFMGLVSSSPRNAMNLNYNNRSMNNNNVTNTWIGARPALVSILKGCASSQNKTICRKDQSIT